MVPPYLQPHKDGVVLAVRVTPKSSRSKITGVVGEELKIALNAPPVDGAANQELIRLLSKTLSIPKSDIELLFGHTARSKKVLLRGMGIQSACEWFEHFDIA